MSGLHHRGSASPSRPPVAVRRSASTWWMGKTPPPSSSLWTLSHPPPADCLAYSSLSWWIHVVYGLVCGLGGLSCLTCGIVAAIQAENARLESLFTTAFLKDLRSISIASGLFGSLQGVLSVVSFFVCLYFIGFTLGIHKNERAYRLQIVCVRAQCLIGSFCFGVFISILVSIQRHFCRFSIPSAIFQRDELASSCSLHIPVGCLLGVSFLSILLPLVIAVRGSGTFFSIFAGQCYLRFFIGMVVNGLAWHFFSSWSIAREEYRSSRLSIDVQRHVDYFHILMFIPGLLTALMTAVTTIFALFAFWRRSQFLFFFDCISTFTTFWFLLSSVCSVFWTYKIRDFFCNISFFYPMDQGVVASEICSASSAFWIFTVASFVVIVLYVFAFFFELVGAFFLLVPPEWTLRKKIVP